MAKVKPVAAPLEAHEVRKMEKEVPEVTAGMASCFMVFFWIKKKSWIWILKTSTLFESVESVESVSWWQNGIFSSVHGDLVNLP